MRPTRIALVLAFCCSAVGAAASCGGSRFTTSSGDAGNPEDAQADVPSDQTTGPEDSGPEAVAIDAEREAAPEDSSGHATDAMPEASTPDAPALDAAGCANGYACVALAPPGWSGPVELFTGSKPPAACPPPYGTVVFEGGVGVVGAPASCSCGCDVDASTMGCGPAPVVYYNGGTGCTGAACYSDSIGVTCQKSDPSPCTGTAEAIIGQPRTVGGSCAAWVDASAPPPSWTLGAIACSSGAAKPAGCASGTVCLPDPVANLCIYSDGASVGCPAAGPYSVPYVLYGGVDDTRGCTPCGCDPTGTCSGTLFNYDNDISCSGSPQGLPIPSGCVTPYSSLGGTYWSGSIGLKDSTCTTDGGAPTGAVTQKNPTTFCCTH